MNIGFISEHYPPTDGGVATSTQRVARELARQNINVNVLCFDNSRPIESNDYVIKEVDNGVKVFRIGPFFLKQTSLSADSLPEKIKATLRRRAFEQMIRILNKEKVDIVLSFYLLNAGYLAQFVAHELQVPHLAGVRGNDIGRNIFNVERFGVIQWIVNNADEIVCVNNHLQKRLLLSFPNAAEKTSVIPNSIRIPELKLPIEFCRKKVETATGWNGEELRAVFIGNLREKKGAVTLLNSLAFLRNKVPIRLLVVGPELGAVEHKLCGDLWKQLKQEGFIFVTDMVGREEVPYWAAGCDLIIMPSLDDGMANGLLEGMALGLCPVASDVFTDIIRHHENGVIVPRGDEEVLAKALRELVANPSKMARLGKNAKSSIINWSPEEEAAAYMAVFQNMLSRQQLKRAVR